MENKKELKEEQLKKVSGGTGESFEPESYLFSCVITRSGVECFGWIDRHRETICYITPGTTIYVLEKEDGRNYVQCTFTQDGMKYTGYIDEQAILYVHQ